MTDLRNRPREPFGPRQPGLWGTLLRMAQWGLAIITVICLWPGAMLVLTALTGFLPTGGSWRMPPVSTLLIDGAWCLWGALLALTALRLSCGWYRRWAFWPVAAIYGVLAMRTYPDAADPVGQCIAALMAAVAGAQCLLHGLWSLCERLLRQGKPPALTILRLLIGLAAGFSGLMLTGCGVMLMWLLGGGLLEGTAEYIQLALMCLQCAAWAGMAVLAACQAGNRSNPAHLWMAFGTAELLATAASLLLASGAARDELLLILTPLMASALLTALHALWSHLELRNKGQEEANDEQEA